MSYDSSQEISESTAAAATATAPAPQACPPAESLIYLWYCNRCTKLILPAGSQGVQNDVGARFCPVCAPFEVADSPPTAIYSSVARISSRRNQRKSPGTGVVKPAEASASQRGASGRSAAISVRLSQPSAARTGPKKLSSAVLGAGIAAIAVMGILVVATVAKRTPPQSTAAKLREKEEPIVFKKVELPGATEAATPKIVEKTLTDKEARQKALAQGAGLFSEVNRVDAKAPESTKAIAETKAVEKAPTLPGAINLAPVAAGNGNPAAPGVSEFDSQIKQISALLEQQRFSEARSALDSAGQKFNSEPWWATRKDSHARTTSLLNEQLAMFEKLATDASERALKANDAGELNTLETIWKPKLALGDTSAKAAERVLTAVAATRERLAAPNPAPVNTAPTKPQPEKAQLDKAQQDKIMAGLVGALDQVQKRYSVRHSKAEAEMAFKDMLYLKSQLAGKPDAIEKLAERWSTLNFDMRMARGPERLLYHLDPCGTDHIELKYDFSSVDQFAAWKFQDDANSSNSIDYDWKTKRMSIAVNGEHTFSGTDKRAPLVKLPFYFSPANWFIEAELNVIKSRDHDKALNPSFGIFVSDAYGNLVRFQAKESEKGSLQLSTRVPGVEIEKDNKVRIPGKQEDKIRLKIAVQNGVASFNANAPARPANGGKVQLANFEPTFVGVFVETPDKEESAVVGMTYFKIVGSWDKEKQKAAIESRRVNDAAAIKAELLAAPANK